jgi:hypothetical protein
MDGKAEHEPNQSNPSRYLTFRRKKASPAGE